ncbi:MAG TPA: hypothetical protein VLC09_15905 [Polyangiaceae bacterium]|nr:hypothetical protein [Polyangiaceae bacterium]
MTKSMRILLTLALTASVPVASCTLITEIDRSKIDADGGGEGGVGGQGGEGAGGSPTGGQGGEGTAGGGAGGGGATS